jgi:hypothetical protein
MLDTRRFYLFVVFLSCKRGALDTHMVFRTTGCRGLQGVAI